jgi:superfamily II DNA or RNA helicase
MEVALLGFPDLNIKTEYRSLLDNVIKGFYTPVLTEAVLYKRAVGFFSSSALIELMNGIMGLVRNGGKIELVASPKLSSEDIEAIEDGFERRKEIIEQCLLRELMIPKGRFEKERLNMLSNLIAHGIIELKIAFLEKDNHIGMFHEKMGLMYDGDNNIIAFTGSMNESATAFSHNYESIDVFTSWSGEHERVLAKQSAFNAIWNDYEPNIKVVSFANVEKELIEKYRTAEITDYLTYNPDDIHDAEVNSANVEEIDIPKYYPRVPLSVTIRPYQNEAIRNWEQREFVGIFDMATGTGKTYTALAATSYLYACVNSRLAVVIVCPYQHLVEQWVEDIELYGMKPIVCYSASRQKDWKSRLKTAVSGFNLGVTEHICVVATNATFSSEYVQIQVSALKGNTLLVVDEAHNFGAINLSKALLPNMKYRLALSATIDRYGDEEGTQKLYDYFGEKCIEYTLKEAIDNGMLTPYYYHPIVVSLNESELSEYLELTRQIVNAVSKSKDKKGELSDHAKMLLIKRARLVAAATEKVIQLKEKISPYTKDSHILVYCGATTMKDVDYKDGQPPVDDVRQIDITVDLLGNELGMRVSKFTSEESAEERESLKKEFAEAKHIQALIAIRCLDEGVNIPSIKTAFILASSTNPKEYVQRRGRVLRTYKGKDFAKIYDFITLPIPLGELSVYSDQIVNNVKSLAIREMVRMKDFASISENSSEADSLIAQIVEAYDINPEDERSNQNV